MNGSLKPTSEDVLPMLEINHLSAYYGSIQALKDVSLKIGEGQIVSMVGANGSGKSTLLKSISGLVTHKKGEILFRGKNISSKPVRKIVKSGISHVLEGRQLFAHLTVLDNINLGAYSYFKRKNMPEINALRDEIFEIFPRLKERRTQLAGTLSGGEQQMLAIGRALMARPDLLLLDEPSLGLAPKIVEDIFSIIKDLNQKGTTIVLVEQNAMQALSISDFAYVFETGKITIEDNSQSLLSNQDVKNAYLGGS